MQRVEEERADTTDAVEEMQQSAESPQDPVAATRYWLILAGFTVTAILMAVIRWSLAHPYGIHWDESGYIDDAFIDVQRLQHWMLFKVAGRVLVASYARPPAYRLLADPVLALFGASTTLARIVSLACYALSSWFVYRSARQLAGRIAGAFAALIFCLSPEVIAASAFFGTEAPLYLSTAAMLFYLLRSLSKESKHQHDWIGLGMAVGVGFLSKTSFLLIGPPALVCWLVVSRHRKSGELGLGFPLKAGAVALLVAGPWWLLHARDALAYAQFARTTVRNSLGPQSLATWLEWANSAMQCVVGHGISILIAVVAIAFLGRVILERKSILTSLQVYGLWVCACAGVPIAVMQIAGTNHLLRYISPAVIPLAIVIGVLADHTIWSRTTSGLAVSTSLIVVQLCMIGYPVVFPNTEVADIGFVNGTLPWRTLARFDQWNLKPLRELSQACNLDSPKISYLGTSRELDPPAIQYPWVMAAMPVRLEKISYPETTWLWRYEDGSFDMQKVIDSAAQGDLVITVPNYVGEARVREDEDNRHNNEFANRLAQDSRFQGPTLFKVGRFTPIEVEVFTKRGLNCQAAPAGSSKP
jgi:hypothetical protein